MAKLERLSDIFTACKAHIIHPDCGPTADTGKCRYICDALGKMYSSGEISETRWAQAVGIIQRRLGSRNCDLGDWLISQGVPEDELTFSRMQAHRLAWLDRLVEEFTFGLHTVSIADALTKAKLFLRTHKLPREPGKFNRVCWAIDRAGDLGMISEEQRDTAKCHVHDLISPFSTLEEWMRHNDLPADDTNWIMYYRHRWVDDMIDQLTEQE